MQYSYDIIIIDSGVNANHEVYKKENIDSICLKMYNDNIVVCDDAMDYIGHGTAVFSIIKKGCPGAKILNIKIFDKEMTIEEELLIESFRYIEKKFEVKIIHLSAGITSMVEKKKLERICNCINKKGTIIVSAFDNYGALSYPATFESVIGVEMSHLCKEIKEYIYVENSPVNLRTFGLNQKLPWINNEYNNVCSNSFSAPYATCIIYNIIKNATFNINELKHELRLKAKRVNTLPIIHNSQNSNTIKKAIVLPFNKEIHSILRYSDLLTFKVEGFYEHPKLLSSNIPQFSAISKKYILKSWNDIDWNGDFDTVIVGHMGLLSDILGDDFLKRFLYKCLKYNKNLFSFDSLETYGAKCLHDNQYNTYFPEVECNNLKESWMYKLPEIATPIVGVFGTSKKQGKFTLQLELRKHFIDLGYTVGQLGTEPSSELFGFDYVFPMGYNSTVKTSNYDSITSLRNMMLRIENKKPDLIIVGSQSQTIPISFNNCLSMPIYNYDFCLGTNPDAMVLVVNIEDEIDYIIRTIKFLEGITEGKVLSLVISPILSSDNWSVIGNRIELISNDELNKHKKLLEQETKLSVFLMDEVQFLVKHLVNYFSEEPIESGE